jgi:hypothetical protein
VKYYSRKILLFVAVLGITLAIAACGGNIDSVQQAVNTEPKEIIPETPEALVRLYQAYVDSNRFELAQSLSTPRSAPLHEMMAAIVADTPFDSSLIHTQFIKLSCEEKQDTAICICLLKDEYEEYESEYIVVRMENRWLMDIPDDEGDFEFFEQEMMEEWPEKK